MGKRKNSRDKGARGERELRDRFNDYGYKTRRGQQYCGANGDADVVGLPGIYIECKRVEKLRLYAAMDKAVTDAKAKIVPSEAYNLPAVFHRTNSHGWLVTMCFDDWMTIYREWEAGNALKRSGENEHS